MSNLKNVNNNTKNQLRKEYYGISDNMDIIQTLEEAIRENPELKEELNIYYKIQELLDKSSFGKEL